MNPVRNDSSPTCSVVVCTRNRPVELDRCLAALAHLNYPGYEIIVVDNAPSDPRAREVALRWGVRYLLEPIPGLSRARNRGARTCKTEIVAYLDDDAQADADWLRVLAHDFEDPRVAVVTGAILPLHIGAVQSSLVTNGPERGERRVVDRNTHGWFEISNFGQAGDGSNMAFRRSVFDAWPGFEENLGRGSAVEGGEEHCAFFTLIERGYRLVYNPASVIRHPEPDTPAEIRRQHLDVLAICTAYMTHLFVEHPSCRGMLLRYTWDRLRARRTKTKNQGQNSAYRSGSRWLAMLAMLSGPWIYLRSRIARANSAKTNSAENTIPDGHLPGVALPEGTCHFKS